MISEAYIYEAIRTPRGKAKNGALHGVKPVTMLTDLIHEILDRNPGLDPLLVEDIVVGCVTPVGDQGANIARTAAIASGLPDAAGAGVTINRFCASALEAVNLTAAKIRSGWESVAIAGGVESMSRVPMGMDGGAWAMDPETAYDTYFVPQGISADLIATIEGFSRDDVDAYAVMSQERAAAAWADGRFAKSVVPVKDRNGIVLLDHDEHMRPGHHGSRASASSSPRSPAWARWAASTPWRCRSTTGSRASTTSTPAATPRASSTVPRWSWSASERIGREAGMTPKGRVVASAVVGTEPTIMLTGPVPATEKVLKTAGLTIDDIDVFEVNEAFAAVVLKWIKDLHVDPDKVNVNGGAIALGHPLGATGAMILGTCLDELERTGGRYGLITLCIGGGMGVATIIERL